MMTGMHPRPCPVCLDPGICRILHAPEGGTGAGGWGRGQIAFSLETLRSVAVPLLSGSGVIPTTHRDMLVDTEEGSVHLVALRVGVGLCGERRTHGKRQQS